MLPHKHNQVKKLPLAIVLLPKPLDSGIGKLKAGSPVRLEVFRLACSLLRQDQRLMPFLDPPPSLLLRSHIFFDMCGPCFFVKSQKTRFTVAFSVSL